MQLNFKTRGKDVSPQGKPRVYFCCHPLDFATYFDSISTEILNLENCAIFFDEQPHSYGDKIEWESRLADMQLFVMPVTSKLLAGNNKGLEDYKIAVQKHIPILPLMQEVGLDSLFNDVCGNLQYLNKYQKDETAISYQEKLKNFLDSVLVGDETAQKIRGAFRSYIFLSYRKKDRVHAQRLMRLVHKCPCCTDVAIWYDEYLVPGEDFNSAIGEALSKSQVFLLSVTPNLVCESNYVQAVEYPMALEAGKTILPVEMCATDRFALHSQFARLPMVISEFDEQTLVAELEKLFACNGNLKDDLARYHLIALAYLDGVDVEVDPTKAVDMLTYCANNGNAPSVKTLADIYKQGKGVERDTNKAIMWQKRLIGLLKDGAINGSDDAKFDYIVELATLASYYKELLQYENSLEVYRWYQEFCENWVSKAPNEQLPKRLLSFAYNYLGETYRKMYDYDKALDCYHLALKYATETVEQEKTAENYNNLVFCYTNFGRCCDDLGDYESALRYAEARLQFVDIIAEMSQDNDYLFALMQCYSDIFDICKTTCEVQKGREAVIKAVELAERIDAEQNDDESKDWLLLAYNRMASLCYMEEKFDEERQWYLKSLDISIKLVDQYASLSARQTLAEILQNLADNARLLGEFDDAEDYISKALYLRETIAEEILISETKSELASAYSSAGTMYDRIRKYDKAIHYLKKAEKLYLELVENNDAPKLQSALSDCYYWLGHAYDEDKEVARQYYEKGLQICLEYCDKLNNDHNLSTLAPFYCALADIYADYDAKKALEYYLKVFEIDLDYAQNHDSIDNWRQCIVDLTHLGQHYYKNLNDNESALKCFENALDIVKDLLKRTHSHKVRNSQAALLGTMATFYESIEDFPNAIRYANLELQIYRELALEMPCDDYWAGIFGVAYILGTLYDSIDEPQLAKQAFFLSLQTLSANKDTLMSFGYIDDDTVLTLYSNIAMSCVKLEQYDSALSYYKIQLDQAQKILASGTIIEQSQVVDILRNIVKMCEFLEQYPEQLQYAVQMVEGSLAIAQAEENASNFINCAKDCKSLADCYVNLGDLQNAIEYYNIAKALCLQVCNDNPLTVDSAGLVNKFYLESSRLQVEIGYCMGNLYYQSDDQNSTIEHLAPAIELSLDLANLTNDRHDWQVLASLCYFLGTFAGIEPLEKAEEVLKMLIENDSTDEFSIQMLQAVREAIKMYQ